MQATENVASIAGITTRLGIVCMSARLSGLLFVRPSVQYENVHFRNCSRDTNTRARGVELGIGLRMNKARRSVLARASCLV